MDFSDVSDLSGDLFGINFAELLTPAEAAAIDEIEAELRNGDRRPDSAAPAPLPAAIPLYPVTAPPRPAVEFFVAPPPLIIQPQAAPVLQSQNPATSSASVSPAPVHPKRPLNSYMIWARTERAKVKAQNPGISNAEASRKLGPMWRTQPPEVKEHYEALAAEERRLFKLKHPNYDYHGNNKKKAKSSTGQEPARKRKRVQPPTHPCPVHLANRLAGEIPQTIRFSMQYVDGYGNPVQLIFA